MPSFLAFCKNKRGLYTVAQIQINPALNRQADQPNQKIKNKNMAGNLPAIFIKHYTAGGVGGSSLSPPPTLPAIMVLYWSISAFNSLVVLL